MKNQSRLDTLTGCLNLWVHMTNKQHVAASIVETLEKSGLSEALEVEGVSFIQPGEDLVDTSRKNAQKLWRWLGQYDGVETNKEKIFDLEQVIVAAMPLDLRVAYLTNIYGDTGVAISPICVTKDQRIDMARMVQVMMKEDTDAHVALMDLAQNPNEQFAQRTKNEIREAISVHVNVLTELEKMFTGSEASH